VRIGVFKHWVARHDVETVPVETGERFIVTGDDWDAIVEGLAVAIVREATP